MYIAHKVCKMFVLVSSSICCSCRYNLISLSRLFEDTK